VIPKPGDPGSETWKDKNNAWKTGGGGIWQTGSYDPATRLAFWGTGNPVLRLLAISFGWRRPDTAK
jgi:alcohol dehydrogenase (cytochrome c)